jgi:glycosyltransferase involved in cell wall biosynthesis
MRRKSFLVYQRTDRFEEYSDQTRGYIGSADRWLSSRADLTVYASRALYEESSVSSKKILIGHGVELTHFDRTKALQAGPPADMTNLKRPIVGFFGDIEGNVTVDLDLIARTSRVLSDVSFVFVGRVVTDLGALRDLPNVSFLGKKPYEDVPRYGAQFDVAIMPWKQNRWIHYCNPIKLKEYLALGLPIVTTEFPEALHYRDVMYVARSRDEFINGIREAVAGRAVGTVESRRARVAGDTWEQATLRIAQTIRELGSESETLVAANGSRHHVASRAAS